MELPNEKQAARFLQEIEKYSDRFYQLTESLLKTEDVDLATSPKDLVFKEDSIKLYRFQPQVEQLCPVPLLITYALVNRETMMDLEQGKSLIRNLLTGGLDIYMIVWGYPARLDRFVTLDDYIDLYMDDCVDFVRKAAGVDKINLMGICQGGTFSTIYTALHPEKIRNLITMVTPIDFDTDDGLLNIWARYLDVDLMVETMGNIPGDFMNLGFLMLKPFQLMIDKYIGMVDSAKNPEIIKSFLRMEKWIFDSPDQAGETFRKFITEHYKKNSLIKGELEIGGRRVNLKNIDMPLLNIYADQDHLVPPSSSIPLGDCVSSKDVTTRNFPVGHIGMYVSTKTQKDLAPLITNWLMERSIVSKKVGSKSAQKAAPQTAGSKKATAHKGKKRIKP